MALDSKYILATASLQMLFRDKDTGLPLRAGVINFFADQSRTTPKLIYKLSGSPPYSDASYVAIGSQITLTEAGTFSDNNGNDIVPYYYPYDNSNNIELYYVVVTSATGVPQFTREAIPNLTIEDANVNGIVNYVPNGQFLAHNNLTDPDNFVTKEITTLGQGGWSFVTVPASAETYKITFDRIGSAEVNLTANPRYKVHLIHESAGTDAKKDLRLKFKNVNRFASDIQDYTYFFTGKSANGNSLSIDLYLIKNFGTGGGASSPTETYVSTVVLPANTESPQNINFLFGLNNSSTLGSNDDDYVELALRPQGTGWNYEVTDFGLTPDNKVVTVYPETTNAEMLSQAVAGWMSTPAYDSSDLYLPLVLTQAGMVFDYSLIGNVVAAGNLSNYSGSVCTNGNLLLADGTQYKYSDFSTLGIPYSRLGNFYLAGGSAGIPQFGTGLNFATTYIESGSTSNLYFTFNKVGTPTSPANGGVSPGFTYKPIIDGTTPFDFSSYSNGSALVTSVCNTVGVAFTGGTSPSNFSDPGTSGMTVADIRNAAGTYYAFQATALTAAALGAGSSTAKYFEFSNTTARYRVWFKTATESAPAAGGNTLVRLDLDLVMTAADVAKVLSSAISGLLSSQITCVAAASVAQSSFFTFTVNAQIYTVWYNKDGAGIEPIVANSIFIPVAILTADTSALVASKTQVELNKVYFAVPNLKGLFLRGYDTDGRWDIDYLNRFSFANTLLGSSPGSFELDEVGSHNHDYGFFESLINVGSGSNVDHFGPTTDRKYIYQTGLGIGSETRPVNASVAWAIKY